MQAYVIKRVLLLIPTLLLATMVVFVILRIVPGDPALAILLAEAQEGDVKFLQEDLDELRKKLGTDKPIHIQYGIWFWNMLQLDFGLSFWDSKPITDRVFKKFPITLELTVLAVLLASVLAVPLGVISAIRQDTLGDYAGRIISIAGIALPNFWVAIMIIFFLVMWFNWIPPLGYVDLWENPWTNVQQLFFPAVALGFSNMAFISRVTRSAMLEVLREDYIRTARSKGLQERVVISRHALKNALLPVVTVSGYEFGRLIAGTVIIEVIFLVPGMGRLLVDAVFHRDFAMVQAIIVMITVVVVLLNVVMDLLYAWLNPRIRYT
jgi:peptide/nickel transport system permease protein